VHDVGVTVRNNGTLATSFLFNSSGTDLFGGSLQDGTATLGLTQSGAGTTYFAGTNSTYTGATRIEAGVAAVSGGAYAKYVKFTPTLMRGGSDNDCQISEFELVLNGANVNFVAFSRFTPLGLDGQATALFVVLLAAAEAAVADRSDVGALIEPFP